MRKIGGLFILAAAAIAIYSLVGFEGREAVASPANLNVHVHDDFYHPAGAFIVGTGTDHNVAQAACQTASPAPACDAVIPVGDTITWVAPAPLAMNPHSVTECTDGTFSVCGPAASAANPIGDSGVTAPPPTGWPYGPVQFNAPGTYYYRCEVHPSDMRGRIVVQGPVVGGIVLDTQGDTAALDANSSSSTGGGPAAMAGIAAAAIASVIALGSLGWYARRRWAP